MNYQIKKLTEYLKDKPFTADDFYSIDLWTHEIKLQGKKTDTLVDFIKENEFKILDGEAGMFRAIKNGIKIILTWEEAGDD